MLNADASATLRTGMPGEALRFLVIGVMAVATDFVVYRALLSLGLPISPSKATSFVAGAIFAYFANRSVTFRVAGPRTLREFARFSGVYGTTLLANVGVNHGVLAMLGMGHGALELAFLAATGVSATLNFLGMKLLVFRTATDASRPSGATGAFDALSTTGIALSLVIPCYNEARNLPLLVARLREVFVDERCEVILVDNGSTDDSPRVLADLLDHGSRIRSIRVEHNQGYGYGILAGLREARGAVIGWTHADMQTDPMDAIRALELFRDGARFVKGRRYGRPLGDVVFTVGMSLFETVLLRYPLWDINAQPTLFSRDFYSTWASPPHDFSLDLFAYHGAARAGLPVRRLPVHFGARAHGVSSWNVDWRAKWRFIKRTVDFSLRLARGL